MSTRLRILILDDESRWRGEIEDALVDLGEGVKVQVCSEMDGAEAAITSRSFDIAIVDLSLESYSRGLSSDEDPTRFDYQGLRFLEDLRTSDKNSFCAVVIVTGRKRTSQIDMVIKRYGASVIGKGEFSDELLIGAMKRSLLAARVKRAKYLAKVLPVLSLQLGRQSVVQARFTKGVRRGDYHADMPTRFDWAPLAKRVDLIEQSLHSEDPSFWRSHSNELGSDLHRELTSNRGIQGVLSTAHFESRPGHRTRYRFATPTEALGIPFEMLRHGEKEDLLCLQGPVSRQVLYPEQIRYGRIEAFHRLMKQLSDQNKSLKILFVAANVDGQIPGVDEEVAVLVNQLKDDFDLVGVKVEAEVVAFEKATYGRVSELLDEESFHVLHYAGHGLHRVDLPEASGLVLRAGAGVRVLNSADLKQLVEKARLHLVFLSSCLGARTAPLVGRGDFHGVLDALARAGVPIGLGYRWIVGDQSAKTLASAFYRSLWRTFSPEEALHEARRKTALEHGWDDPTWASPILLLQN
jgi:DNA-binding NarL/FixJ family response regulator